MKYVGKAFLYNQGCYLVDTEIKLNHLGLRRFQELDNHTIIDVCGVGLKYFPNQKKSILGQEKYQDFEPADPGSYEYGYNIIRGIEVKVSRSDFRNGFICSGCNYHYILAPMRMLAPYEIPKGVGLIEHNKYKFSCEAKTEKESSLHRRAFNLKGVRVVKKPAYKRVPQFQIDNAISNIAIRQLEHYEEKLLQDIEKAYTSMPAPVRRKWGLK